MHPVREIRKEIHVCSLQNAEASHVHRAISDE